MMFANCRERVRLESLSAIRKHHERRLAVQGVRRASQIGVRSYDFKAVDPATGEQRMIPLNAAGDEINMILDLNLRGIHIHKGL